MDGKEKKDKSKRRVTRCLAKIEQKKDTNKGRVTRSLAKMELKRSRTSKAILTRNKRMRADDNEDSTNSEGSEVYNKTHVACSTRPKQTPFSTVADDNEDSTNSDGSEVYNKTHVACSTRPKQTPFSTVAGDTEDSTDSDDAEDDLDLLSTSTSKKRKRKIHTKKPTNHLGKIRSILRGVRTWKEIVDEENEKIPRKYTEVSLDDLDLFKAFTSKKKKKEMSTIKSTYQPGAWQELLDIDFENIPNGLDLLIASTTKKIEKEIPTIKPVNQPGKQRDILNGPLSGSEDSLEESQNQARADPNGSLLGSEDSLEKIQNQARADPNGSLGPLIEYAFKLLKRLKRSRIRRANLRRAVSTEDSTDSDDAEGSLSTDSANISSQKFYPSKSILDFHENAEQFLDMSHSSSSLVEERPLIKPFPRDSYLYDIESVVSTDSVDSDLHWINTGQKNFPYLSFQYYYKLANNRSKRFDKVKDVALIEEKDRIAGSALVDLLTSVDLSDVDLSDVENTSFGRSNSRNVTCKNVLQIPRFELPCTNEFASWNSQKKKYAEKQVSKFNARIALIELFKDIFIEIESTQSQSNNELNSENRKITLSEPEIAEEFSQPKNSDDSKLSESNTGLNLANQNSKTFSKTEIADKLSQPQNSDEDVAGSTSMVEGQNLNKCDCGCTVWSDIHSEFWRDFHSEFWSGIHSEINSANQNRKTSSKQEIAEAFSQPKNYNESELSESNNELNSVNQYRKTLSKPEIDEIFSEPNDFDGNVAGSSSVLEEKNPNKCKWGCTVFNKEPCFHKKCINYLYEKFPIPEIAEAFLQPKYSDKSDFLDSNNENNSVNRKREILPKPEIAEAFSKPKNSNESELSVSNRLNSANQNRESFSKPEIAEKLSQPINSDEAVAGSSNVLKEKNSNKCKWGCTVLREEPCFHEKCIKYLYNTSSKQEIAEAFLQPQNSNEAELAEGINRLNSVNQNRKTLPEPQINEAKTVKEKNKNKESKCKFGCTVLNEKPCFHKKWIKYVKENETKLRKEVEERINQLKIESRKNYEKEVIDRFIKNIANINFVAKK